MVAPGADLVNRNLIVSIFGRKGSGKTELSKKIAADFPRVIAVDTVAQYGPEDGFEVYFGRDACAAAIVKAEKRDEFRISLRSDDTEDLLQLFRVIYEVTDILVLVDETPFYASPQKLPTELSLLVRYGRHRRISQVYIAQRPSEIHRSITAQSDIVVTFVQREKRDVAYLMENGAEDIGATEQDIRELPKYKLLAFGDGMGREDVPVAILAQMHELHRRDSKQIDMDFERQ